MSDTGRVPPANVERQRVANTSIDGCRVRTAKRKCAPVKSMAEAIKRFKETRPWHVDGNTFNVDTFKRKQEEHRLAYDFASIQPMGQTYAGAQNRSKKQEQNITLQTVPLFAIGEHSFFVDPNDPMQGGFSVYTDSGREIAKSRGFVELKFSHLTTNQAIPQRTSISKATTALADRPAPSYLKIPNNNIPNLFKKDGETYAEALVRAFEEKFIDEVGDEIYSPCKMWAGDEARKGATFKSSQLSKFTGWCNAYYAVRVVKKDSAKFN